MRKSDFPYFLNNKTVYLDNAATTQKPNLVIDSVVDFYSSYCSNTHRGSYEHGNKATIEYEKSRNYVKSFLGASSIGEIVFTKGVTEGINMVASSFVGKKYNNVIISSLEHHSNIVPWHIQGRTIGDGLQVVNFNKDLTFNLDHFESLLKKTPNSFVSVTHVSNAFGVVYPVKEIVEISHKYGAKVLIDGAQSLSRFSVDISSLKADFYTVSGHKCYGPTGVGVLYINESLLDDFKPYQTGGATIEDVSFTETTLLKSPYCFEAGTQNIAGVIGIKKAYEYISQIGYKQIEENEKRLVYKIYKELENIEDIELYTNPEVSTGNISFNIKSIVPIDIGILLDKQNVAVRCGHHCAMPIMKALNIDGTIRISLALYNDDSDIEKFFNSLKKSIKILKS